MIRGRSLTGYTIVRVDSALGGQGIIVARCYAALAMRSRMRIGPVSSV